MGREVRYVWPVLSSHDWGVVRIGGPGLANCMFVAARAYLESRRRGCWMVAPTWRKLSIGPLLRHERDKRVYNRLFNDIGVKGLKKLLLSFGCTRWMLAGGRNLLRINGLGGYFADLDENYEMVLDYFDRITRPETVAAVDPAELVGAVAVHVRLGDYVPRLRVDIEWYRAVMAGIIARHPGQRFVIFSDGTDAELQPLLNLPGAERRFYGNAYADMYAISRCKMLIASDSTFSAWGAFLGRVPVVFCKRHFPPVFSCGGVPEVVIGASTQLPPAFDYILNQKTTEYDR